MNQVLEKGRKKSRKKSPHGTWSNAAVAHPVSARARPAHVARVRLSAGVLGEKQVEPHDERPGRVGVLNRALKHRVEARRLEVVGPKVDQVRTAGHAKVANGRDDRGVENGGTALAAHAWTQVATRLHRHARVVARRPPGEREKERKREKRGNTAGVLHNLRYIIQTANTHTHTLALTHDGLRTQSSTFYTQHRPGEHTRANYSTREVYIHAHQLLHNAV